MEPLNGRDVEGHESKSGESILPRNKPLKNLIPETRLRSAKETKASGEATGS